VDYNVKGRSGLYDGVEGTRESDVRDDAEGEGVGVGGEVREDLRGFGL